MKIITTTTTATPATTITTAATAVLVAKTKTNTKTVDTTTLLANNRCHNRGHNNGNANSDDEDGTDRSRQHAVYRRRTTTTTTTTTTRNVEGTRNSNNNNRNSNRNGVNQRIRRSESVSFRLASLPSGLIQSCPLYQHVAQKIVKALFILYSFQRASLASSFLPAKISKHSRGLIPIVTATTTTAAAAAASLPSNIVRAPLSRNLARRSSSTTSSSSTTTTTTTTRSGCTGGCSFLGGSWKSRSCQTTTTTTTALTQGAGSSSRTASRRRTVLVANLSTSSTVSSLSSATTLFHSRASSFWTEVPRGGATPPENEGSAAAAAGAAGAAAAAAASSSSSSSAHSTQTTGSAMSDTDPNDGGNTTTEEESEHSGSASPPVAHREEGRVLWAGAVVAPPSDSSAEETSSPPPPPPRQSESSTEALLDPPVAISDPYGWMRDDTRTSSKVLEHLKAENEYTEASTRHLRDLRETLYSELIGSLQETDYTVPRPRTARTAGPNREGGQKQQQHQQQRWWYYRRTIKGKSYPIHCRAPVVVVVDSSSSSASSYKWDGTAESPILPDEQVLLDVNALAKDQSYCAVGTCAPSPSQSRLVYTVDFTGGETCQIHLLESLLSSSEAGEGTNEDTDKKTQEDDKDGKNTDPTILMERGPGVDVDKNKPLEVDGRVIWGADDSVLFYMKLDAQHRPYQVYQRRLIDSEEEEDTLLFEELDELFWIGIGKSLDGNYLLIESSSKETSEVWYLDLTKPLQDDASKPQSSSPPRHHPCLKCVAPRRFKVLYSVQPRHGVWWIVTNVGGTPNMRLMTMPIAEGSNDGTEGLPSPEWMDVMVRQSPSNREEADNSKNMDDPTLVPCFDGGHQRSLASITCFNTHVVAEGREGGIPRVWVMTPAAPMTTMMEKTPDSSTASLIVSSMVQLQFEEEAHDVGLSAHYEFDAADFVVGYDSLITPLCHLEIPLSDPTRGRRVLKQKQVPGYDKSAYGCERFHVTARDGKTQIPVSMVYRKDVMEKKGDGASLPLHLYGYGSYGSCEEADFAASRLALLDRGVVCATAHVRGGGEMGRPWYEAPNGAKYLCKRNTFHDFVDVGRYLVEERRLTNRELLSCEGRSAGGLLIGASINEAPDLFRVALMDVPFVDIVPTMIDPTIPLTVVEWEEWGNPNEEKYFAYMMEYSPVQNIDGAIAASARALATSAGDDDDDDHKEKKRPLYPSCFITGGLHDPRVPYWEPAKFAAQVRHSLRQHERPKQPDIAQGPPGQPSSSTAATTTTTTTTTTPTAQDEEVVVGEESPVVCLKTDLTSGHFSASDRYKYYKELAIQYAFLLDQLGLARVDNMAKTTTTTTTAVEEEGGVVQGETQSG